MKSKGTTLIELLIVVVLICFFISALVYNFDSLQGNRYFEARENFKTFLINQKHKAAYFQEEYTIEFDNEYNINSNDNDLLATFTNDLKVIESSATKIVFLRDNTVEESYIITSSLDGKITNKFIINVIGRVNYE
jgi:type II secretory pathway pseudopilin PulG